MYDIKITVDTSKLEKIRREASEKIIDATAREAAFEILRRADMYLDKQVYTRPNVQVTADRMDVVPEPTGALRNSGYVDTYTKNPLPPDVNDENEAIRKASKLRKNLDPGIPPEPPTQPGQVRVVFATEYAYVVEMGNSKGMVPRPYLAPAVLEVSQFIEKLAIHNFRKAGFY